MFYYYYFKILLILVYQNDLKIKNYLKQNKINFFSKTFFKRKNKWVLSCFLLQWHRAFKRKLNFFLLQVIFFGFLDRLGASISNINFIKYLKNIF